jgi:hypothetical protein
LRFRLGFGFATVEFRRCDFALGLADVAAAGGAAFFELCFAVSGAGFGGGEAPCAAGLMLDLEKASTPAVFVFGEAGVQVCSPACVMGSVFVWRI